VDDARDLRREPSSASGWGGRRISPIAPTAFALLLLASFACDTSGSSKSDLPDPFAAYSFEQVSGTLSVHFRNVSLKIDSSEWDFGDGSVLDATKSPVHTFSAAGVYEVKLTVTFPGGQSTRVRAVVVVPTPTISLVASPDFLRAGEMTTLIWSSANSISCVASGGNWSGAKNPAGGAEAVTVDSDTSYRLECTGSGASGTVSTSVDVAVELEIASASVRAGDQPKQLQFSWAVLGSTDLDHFVLETNPDGISGYSQVDLDRDGMNDGAGDRLDAGDRVAHLTVSVHLENFASASYQIVARNAAEQELDRSNELLVSTAITTALIGYVKASNPGMRDLFGFDVVISADGNTFAVAAGNEGSSATGVKNCPCNGGGGEANDDVEGSGAVYVFGRASDGSWSQEAYIKASSTSEGDFFGYSLSLSSDGNTLAVGSQNEDSGSAGIDGDPTNNSLEDAGAAYVFRRNAEGRWSREAYLKAAYPDADDTFGWDVDLAENGSLLAVGAPGEDSNATGVDGDQEDDSLATEFDGPGAVYLYRRSVLGVWSQANYVKASNPTEMDSFGYAVDLSEDGRTLAVGAVGEDSNARGINPIPIDDALTESGAAYLFTQDDMGDWAEEAFIKASNSDAEDGFGFALSLSDDGETLAVGAVGEASNASGIDGNEDDNSLGEGLFAAGAVYVFRRDDGDRSWSKEAYVKASNPDELDRFGFAVTLSANGDILVVGADSEDSGATGINGNQTDNSAEFAGAAYVFVRDPIDGWSQHSYLKAPNTDPTDQFGYALDLSADATTLVVGAPAEDSNASGVNGNQNNESLVTSGAVYLY